MSLTETLARIRIWTGLDHRHDASVQAWLRHDGQFATDTSPGEFKGGTIQFVGVTVEKAQYLDLERLAMAAMAVD